MSDSFIPLSEPYLSGKEWDYVKDCLDTNWVSSAGKYVNQFEEAVASYVGQPYAVACVNGTAALHIALIVAGVQANEEVLVPALTFVAPANAIRYIGAWPTFIDVRSDTWQLDPKQLKLFLLEECEHTSKGLVNKQTGRLVKAIMPVDIMGHPVDWDEINEIAQQYNLLLIQDASESLGASYKGKKVGAQAPIACLSFNGNKTITSGGGGMIVTSNQEWAARAKYLTTQAKDDGYEYIHQEIGYNYRLCNVLAAMGLAQLESLDDFVEYKRCIAYRYAKGLKNIKGITLPSESKSVLSTFWLYTILIDDVAFGIDNHAVLAHLTKENIQSRPFWRPLHLLEPFKESYAFDIQEALRLYKQGLSLPTSTGLTEENQRRVIDVIKRCGV